MRDEEIIELYFKRDERAIEETDYKYGDYCASIADKILKNELDVEECLDDTYLRVWNVIPPTRPEIFRIFIGKITRNLAFDRYEKFHAKKRGGGNIEEVLDELQECIPANHNVEQSILANELSYIINDFVKNLPEKEALIFVGRYFYTEDISAIGKRLGMTNNNVSVTLNRIRAKLQKRLLKEGYLAS